MTRPRTRDKVSAVPTWTNAYMRAHLEAQDAGYDAEQFTRVSVDEYEEGNWLASAAALRKAAENLFYQGELLAKAAGILETGRDAAA